MSGCFGIRIRSAREILGCEPRPSQKELGFYKKCLREKMTSLQSSRYMHQKGRYKGRWNYSRLAENINIVGISPRLAKRLVLEMESENS